MAQFPGDPLAFGRKISSLRTSVHLCAHLDWLGTQGFPVRPEILKHCYLVYGITLVWIDSNGGHCCFCHQNS